MQSKNYLNRVKLELTEINKSLYLINQSIILVEFNLPFNLIDFFAYLFPGGLLLYSIAYFEQREDTMNVILDYIIENKDAWLLLFLILISLSYTLGHVNASISS